MKAAVLIVLAGCAGSTKQDATFATLRPACAEHQYWDGHACKASGDAPARLAAGRQALAELKVDEAKAALDAAAQAGPLDHATNVGLWEQRGIAAAYLDDNASAKTAFDMMLALDPAHLLDYTLSPKATFVFQDVRRQAGPAPAIDVNWPHGGKVGDPVPLDVEVLADPKQFLRRATVFVRTRGEPSWRAADLTLDAKKDQRVLLPAIDATKPVSLELYVRAYDDHGNEVLTWADPKLPREIPLRYEPPRPWYYTWWGISALAAGALAIGGVTAYELTLAPPDKIGGTATVSR